MINNSVISVSRHVATVLPFFLPLTARKRRERRPHFELFGRDRDSCHLVFQGKVSGARRQPTMAIRIVSCIRSSPPSLQQLTASEIMTVTVCAGVRGHAVVAMPPATRK